MVRTSSPKNQQGKGRKSAHNTTFRPSLTLQGKPIRPAEGWGEGCFRHTATTTEKQGNCVCDSVPREQPHFSHENTQLNERRTVPCSTLQQESEGGYPPRALRTDEKKKGERETAKKRRNCSTTSRCRDSTRNSFDHTYAHSLPSSLQNREERGKRSKQEEREEEMRWASCRWGD